MKKEKKNIFFSESAKKVKNQWIFFHFKGEKYNMFHKLIQNTYSIIVYQYMSLLINSLCEKRLLTI